ncbi:MAG: class I SAM-dependent methyltransferase [Burkholderiaceae bacterium]
MEQNHPNGETEEVRRRYAKRQRIDWRYSVLNPAQQLPTQERERVLCRMLRSQDWTRLNQIKVTDVGCGGAGNLLMLLRFGFAPENLTGIELLVERYERARQVLPPASRVILGDATVASVEPASQDLVMQNLVFSTLLDLDFQQRLADAMWSWLRPGGAVIWHDFMFNNPRNKDTRGVPVSRIKELFPHGKIEQHRITLAPPISRLVTRIHPSLYTVFNALPLLRTHILAWIEKPEGCPPHRTASGRSCPSPS